MESSDKRFWIKLNYSIKEHWVWDDKPFAQGQAWIDLLLYVFREDSKEPINGQIEITKAGSRWVGMNELADRWGWSRNRVIRFVKLLESDGMVTTKCTTKGTLVTIVNWGFFQGQRTTSGTTNGATSAQRVNNKRTLKENIKSIENVRDKEESPDGQEDDEPFDFNDGTWEQL